MFRGMVCHLRARRNCVIKPSLTHFCSGQLRFVLPGMARVQHFRVVRHHIPFDSHLFRVPVLTTTVIRICHDEVPRLRSTLPKPSMASLSWSGKSVSSLRVGQKSANGSEISRRWVRPPPASVAQLTKEMRDKQREGSRRCGALTDILTTVLHTYGSEIPRHKHELEPVPPT
jgi:hypothetical protein